MSGRRDAGKCSVVLRVTLTVPPSKETASRRSNNRGGVVEELGGMECRVHAMEVHEKEQSRKPARVEQMKLMPTRAELMHTGAE